MLKFHIPLKEDHHARPIISLLKLAILSPWIPNGGSDCFSSMNWTKMKSIMIRSSIVIVFCIVFAVQVNGFQHRLVVSTTCTSSTSSTTRISNDVPPRTTTTSSFPPLESARFSEVSKATNNNVLWEQQESVPTNLKDAIRVFFLSGDCGPSYVVLALASFVTWRNQLSSQVGVPDIIVFAMTFLFWSFQEHFLHEKVLHSKADWIGKDIHQTHHDKPYYHISLDPAILLIGWMLAAHCFFQLLLPLPLALTASVAYSSAGLFYEWAHYIVHTRVKCSTKFWKRVKENHMRHHLVSDNYWYAFSLPWMDDWFQTNPDVRQVQRRKSREKNNKEQHLIVQEDVVAWRSLA